jgi:hypothetical protein
MGAGVRVWLRGLRTHECKHQRIPRHQQAPATVPEEVCVRACAHNAGSSLSRCHRPVEVRSGEEDDDSGC